MGDEAKPQGRARPLPDYFYRLPTRLQRCYLRSESIERFDNFVPSSAVQERLDGLMESLEGGALREVQGAAQELMRELCVSFGVAPIKVDIRGVRPHNTRGELHGLFRLSRPPEILLWMRTAQRHEVVKPKTFVRTLLHELCHYLDYALLALEDSFHTMGFFKRESFLVRELRKRRNNVLR